MILQRQVPAIQEPLLQRRTFLLQQITEEIMKVIQLGLIAVEQVSGCANATDHGISVTGVQIIPQEGGRLEDSVEVVQFSAKSALCASVQEQMWKCKAIPLERVTCIAGQIVVCKNH